MNQSEETTILENFVELVKSPYGNFVAIGNLSQVLNNPITVKKVVKSLSLTPQGKQAFTDYPLLGDIDLQQLYQLEKPTLGYAYAEHMITNELTPPVNNENKIISNPFMFLNIHLAETHDIWHVVTGSNTDKPGEVQLEAFYVSQLIPDRLFLALLAKNLLKTAMYDVELCEQIMDGLTQGWIMGKQAKPLFGIQWNKLWERSLKDIQVSLDIAPVCN